MSGVCAKCRDTLARQAERRGFAVPGDAAHPFTGTDYAFPARVAGRCPSCGSSAEGGAPKWDEQRRDFVSPSPSEVISR